MWYIDAMKVKGLATLAVVLALTAAPAILAAQTAPTHTSPAKPSTPSYAAPAADPARSDCNGVPCEDQTPRTIYVPSAPAPVAWAWHDRILWAAYLVLALLGYAGIMLANSTLKKIERHAAAAEETAATSASAAAATATAAAATATAAAETAQAALLHAQSILNAERPWLTIAVEPTLGVQDSFNVIATNRGRSPATITSALYQVLFAADEAHLPPADAFSNAEPKSPFVPIILLPGEYATLRTLKREDARELCGTDEQFLKVEVWAEKLFLRGKVIYNDLIAPAGKATHETNWCCWYIHGRQKSALVLSGLPELNAHT